MILFSFLDVRDKILRAKTKGFLLSGNMFKR